ncbi:hypothetical protein MtrunA17_Chr7g0228571 [Medicago truncatula]|uniref:Uncharacterized protein n=1 Tax=Medicago truncatula TaxID=3880 RepID=A0A396H2B7_MEDTR|nr:hypothetical protein MtrunA17_Chr7g0228571 [Medicago truncatula]
MRMLQVCSSNFIASLVHNRLTDLLHFLLYVSFKNCRRRRY